MSKRILLLSSTPRKGGNSDILCDQFGQGAQEAGHIVEKVRISEQKIHYCTGCGVCNEKHQCVQKDDMANILEKMVQADVIVLATPVYFYSMCAQMKTLIDRTVPRYTEISNKDFYFIVTAADSSAAMMQRTIEGLRGFTEDCLNGAVEKGIIYGVGAWDKGEIRASHAMEEAFRMGMSI